MTTHKFIEKFNPHVEMITSEYEDYLYACDFSSGEYAFDQFIKTKEAKAFANDGDGVTYLLFDIIEEDNAVEKKLVGYFTLASSSIPYFSIYKNEQANGFFRKKKVIEIDKKICGINAVEIKMFAIDRRYQDLFYRNNGESMPISAWMLNSIIDYIKDMSVNVIGAKAIFLHSVKCAESFYRKNKFQYFKTKMFAFWSVDDEMRAMYLPIQDIDGYVN